MHALPVVLVFTLAPLPAAAQGQEALQLFLAGSYDEALDCTEDAADADSAAFTARVLLAEALSNEVEPETAVLNRAVEEADRALALQPEHVEGRLQKAIALSLLARPMSLSQVQKEGRGVEARDLAESVLEDDPHNAYAHAFLSVWNVEVLRRGGTLGAMMMGASLKKARRHYEAAGAAMPDDASIHWQWARALAALDAKKYRKEVEAALAAAETAATDSELEGVMQRRAKELDGILSGAGPKAAEVRALEML